jgi:C4-dicarboxylate transporter, DcuC family
MAALGIVFSFVFIIGAGYLLYKKYNPQAILLLSGLAMYIIAYFTSESTAPLKVDNDFFIIGIFDIIKDTFSTKMSEIGLMIMVIGGYVAYMDHMGANKALIYVAMKPLSYVKKYPYLVASCIIPIGHLLSIPIPSAAGLGLLLIASVYPVLIHLGVSKVSAVAVIVSTTTFDMGPASVNTLLAAELVGKSPVNYFIEDQVRVAFPLILISAILYYFVNKHYDKKDKVHTESPAIMMEKPAEPLLFGILPIFPLLLLVVFSDYFSWFGTSVKVSTVTAMFISLFLSLLFLLFFLKDLKTVLASLNVFWKAMGKVFASIVTLIVAAEIFANGLINLGFISFLIDASLQIGLHSYGIAILMILLILGASMLMGSGNASFYSFGPLVPDLVNKLGVESVKFILPMQLTASLGRALSPIAGVIIATSEIAGVKPIDVVKRNLIPLLITFLFLILFSL